MLGGVILAGRPGLSLVSLLCLFLTVALDSVRKDPAFFIIRKGKRLKRAWVG